MANFDLFGKPQIVNAVNEQAVNKPYGYELEPEIIVYKD